MITKRKNYFGNARFQIMKVSAEVIHMTLATLQKTNILLVLIKTKINL